MDGRETVKRRKDKILGHKEQKIIASREERKDVLLLLPLLQLLPLLHLP